jgi:hypothetical protein
MPPGSCGRTAILGAVLLVAACSSSSQPVSQPTQSTTSTPSRPAEPVVLTPVLAEVIAAPVPVPATDGKVHLAYELHVTNVLGQDVTLSSVAVRAGDKTLLSLAGDRLAYWMRPLGSQAPTTKLGPAQSGIIWLDVVIDGPTDSTPAVPEELSHTIVVTPSNPTPPLFPATVTEDVAPVTVSTQEPAVIAPPLDGPRWLDGNSCCDMTAHRMAVNPLNGQLWAAERFAVDYVQLSPDGTIFSGDPTKPESYPYFGADVHAVADGPVVAVVDGLPEQVPGRSPTGLPLDQYGGNHVVQDISDGKGDHYYAFYAHLETGTVKVKPGDRLTTGQVIGNLGNTGNTDAPHLHFHVMSTPDPLKSNGLPFVFKSFKLDGRLASMAALDPILAGKPAVNQPGFAARDETNVGPLVLDEMTYATR